MRGLVCPAKSLAPQDAVPLFTCTHHQAVAGRRSAEIPPTRPDPSPYPAPFLPAHPRSTLVTAAAPGSSSGSSSGSTSGSSRPAAAMPPMRFLELHSDVLLRIVCMLPLEDRRALPDAVALCACADSAALCRSACLCRLCRSPLLCVPVPLSTALCRSPPLSAALCACAGRGCRAATPCCGSAVTSMQMRGGMPSS